jgi:hypothetical protein
MERKLDLIEIRINRSGKEIRLQIRKIEDGKEIRIKPDKKNRRLKGK